MLIEDHSKMNLNYVNILIDWFYTIFSKLFLLLNWSPTNKQ